jgi:hypothetical protein
MAQTLTITWETPSTDNSPQQVTGYTLSYKKASENVYTKITGVTSPYVLGGLNGGTNYDICIQSNCTPSCISEKVCTTKTTNADPTPTPNSTSTPTPTPTPTPTSTSTPTPTPSPTSTGEPSTPTPTPTSTPIPPTSTPFETILNNIYVSDPLNSNPTEQDLTFAIQDACDGDSNINTFLGGPATMTVYGSSICDASGMFDPDTIIASEVTSGGIIILRQSINNFGGSGGIKLWYRKFQRSVGVNVNMYTPIGGCLECGVPTPTATVPPQITVNIYGRQNIPYNAVSNNLQLVYQTYSSTLGPLNHTSSGVQKSLIEGETFLVSPNVDAGGYLNLGLYLRETDGACDYLEVNVNVFAAGAYLSSRFTDSTGSLLSDYGCGLQGALNGVSIPVSQAIDVYITPTSTGVCFGSSLIPPGLECLTTNQ